MGPPLGGVLFEKLGFRAPFILSIAFAVVDLIGRLLVIEKAEAVKWLEKEKQPEVSLGPTQGVDGTTNVPPLQTVASEGRSPQLSVIQVVIALCKNRKAATAFIRDTLLWVRGP
jgi:MFS family permease